MYETAWSELFHLTEERLGCDAKAVEIVAAALRAGHGDRTHVLPNRPAAPREAVERLEALGVVEGCVFHTKYACCVGRVTNIKDSPKS